MKQFLVIATAALMSFGAYAQTVKLALIDPQSGLMAPVGINQLNSWASRVVVNCFRPLPSMLATSRSGLPPLLRIMATREPSGETAGL